MLALCLARLEQLLELLEHQLVRLGPLRGPLGLNQLLLRHQDVLRDLLLELDLTTEPFVR